MGSHGESPDKKRSGFSGLSLEMQKTILGETLTATRKDCCRILRQFFHSWDGESAFYCANHRISCKCQQPPRWKIHRFSRWKMPFAVFRCGSGVSEIFLQPSERESGNSDFGIRRRKEGLEIRALPLNTPLPKRLS